MKWEKIFLPKTILTAREVTHGLRALTWESVASTGFSSLTSGAFLAAFALALGASNLQIGILAGLPFIADLLQVPAVWLVEKTRLRKAFVLVLWIIAQLLWVPVALIPLFMKIPGGGAVSVLIGIIAARGAINAFTNCGWNSWIRDLIPQTILGRFTARKESLAAAVALVLGLGAGYFIDHWNGGADGPAAYSLVLLVGLAFFGLASPVLMAFIPEPGMPAVKKSPRDFTGTLIAPLREKNYRSFLKFLTFWGFATSMAIPFFAVFMLQHLGLSVFAVIVLVNISELFTVISLRIWGPLADRFGSKNVLYLSSSLFLMVLVGWAATAIAGRDNLLFPLLGLLHIFSGIAVAGITLATGTLSFKLSPHGKATPYLTGASLAESAGIGLGAVFAGYAADLLGRQGFSFKFSEAGVFSLTGYHLLFIFAAVLCLVSLRCLNAVQEYGCARKGAVLPALIEDIRRKVRLPWKIQTAGMLVTGTVKIPVSFVTGGDEILPVREPCVSLALPGLLRKLLKKPPPCYGLAPA